MSDQQDRIKRAVTRYTDRESRKYRKAPGKPVNKKPEEEVVSELLKWLRSEGFFIQRYESKAKWDGRIWRTQGLSEGTPDLMGCDHLGHFVAIEVKAPGKRSTLRPKQREFLMNVVDRKGFGICCDSLRYLKDIYSKWIETKDQIWLGGELPFPKKKDLISF